MLVMSKSSMTKSNISNCSTKRKNKPKKTNSKNYEASIEEWAFLNWVSFESSISEVFE